MTITLYECLSLGVTIDEWSSLSIVDRNQHIRPVYFNIKESRHDTLMKHATQPAKKMGV